MSVINAEQFKSKATRVVEISGFEENEKIEVRIKSMSLLTMMNNGKIPNELLGVVQKLFNEGANSKKKKISEKDILSQSDDIKSITMLMDVACKEVLVEPKFEEIEDYLTDVQKTEIFNAAQGPVKQVIPSVPK
ncbi:hypothetical protein [Terrisporobacter hibernicus]|uniref:Uncharacterized protein n=2 Tax=Peptostreptococcaceae TaxID=186804 RepID=A0AAX2ZIT3_9FIRM|nr:hypothetical protein [Terrisporobacter hibernicus]UEL47587.1 hypothetical protein JW646_18510 [Terrisporobacter hibernicus]